MVTIRRDAKPARRTEAEVTDLLERIQWLWDVAAVPQATIEKVFGLNDGLLPVWIKRGRVRPPVGCTKQAVETQLAKQQETMVGAGGVVAPNLTRAVPPGVRPAVQPIQPMQPPIVPNMPAMTGPEPTIEELRTWVKMSMAGSITDAKAVAAYAQALNHLMTIKGKERDDDREERTAMAIYAPSEDYGPDDE